MIAVVCAVIGTIMMGYLIYEPPEAVGSRIFLGIIAAVCWFIAGAVVADEA